MCKSHIWNAVDGALADRAAGSGGVKNCEADGRFPSAAGGTERLSVGTCRQAAAALAGRREAAPAHQANRGS